MGRMSRWPVVEHEPRSVYLTRVQLDSGGYDNGGAYWGLGLPVWWAVSRSGDLQGFTRAATRFDAVRALDIPRSALISTQGIPK